MRWHKSLAVPESLNQDRPFKPRPRPLEVDASEPSSSEHSTLGSYDKLVRPLRFSDFVGQRLVCQRLAIYVEAARSRNEALDHVLLHGPPGLGKTTIARIVANELRSEMVQTSGPVLKKAGDLAALLTRLQPFDVLFIDEIHRLDTQIEEILYPAMEEHQLDFVIGEGPAAKAVKLRLPPFTLVGATTKAGLLSAPLRDRFGIHQRLEFYATEELEHILMQACERLKLQYEPSAITIIAQCSRGTPRIAHRLLRRIRDYAQVKGQGKLTPELTQNALDMMEVDRNGLDRLDRKILQVLIQRFGGGPVGVENLATSVQEEVATVEDIVEPFLIQQGLIKRTATGRQALDKAYQWLRLERQPDSAQGELGVE